MALTNKITAIANAIRNKTGETGTMTLDQMPTKIASIPTTTVTGTNKTAEIASKTVTEITETDLAGISAIGDSAFYKCNKLTTVSLPRPLITIGSNAFESCTALTTINFKQPSWELEPCAYHINYMAFAYCSGLIKVKLAKTAPYTRNTTYIGQRAFYYCSKLQKIYLPENVKISKEAFYGCSALTDIYYEGTLDEWKLQTGITGDEYGNWDDYFPRGSAANITVHFSAVPSEMD